MFINQENRFKNIYLIIRLRISFLFLKIYQDKSNYNYFDLNYGNK